MIQKKKFIEVTGPLEAINEEGSWRKRKAPAGCSTALHKWWARRPLAPTADTTNRNRSFGELLTRGDTLR
jgi:hypothetical protein